MNAINSLVYRERKNDQSWSILIYYSVLLTPPMMAGLQSLAHLNMEEKILTK